MTRGLDLFPDSDYLKVKYRVEERWDLSGLFPLPLWDVHCPCCRENDVQIRSMGFFRRARANNPFRCDVHFKCKECSLVWLHGIVITEGMYDAHSQDTLGTSYDWKSIRNILKPKDAPALPMSMDRIREEIAMHREAARKGVPG